MKILSTIVLFHCISFVCSAQDIYTLSVITSDNTYLFDVANSEFGGSVTTTINSELTFAVDDVDPINNSCQEVSNDIENKTAMVFRGECTFIDKAINIQNAGGIVMILCNQTNEVTTMNGDTDEVTIPCVMASSEDCELIELLLTNEPDTEITLSNGIAASNNDILLSHIEYSIYPNPTQGSAIINFSSKIANREVSINIIDVNGATLLTQHFDRFHSSEVVLSIGHLPSGTYILNGNIGDKRFIQSLVVD